MSWALLLLIVPHEFIKRKLAEALDLLPSQHCFRQVVRNNSGRRMTILTQPVFAFKAQKFSTDREKSKILVV